MKKILFLFFLFIFLSKKIYGSELLFNRYENNPLRINLMSDYFYILQVDIFKKDNYGCSGIATVRRKTENFHSLIKIDSIDCINWKMTKEIMNIGEDITNPRIFIDNNEKINLFFAKQDDIDFYKIYQTDCDKNFNCSSNIKLILDPNKNNQNEKNGYFAPKILKYQDKYYMFYGVWGVDGFKIRLAYSDDFNNWKKCNNDLITDGADGPFPIIKENFLYIFYHKSDSSGIKLSRANLPINCDLNFQDMGYLIEKNYNIKHLIFPSIILEENNFKLFYSALDGSNKWNLNLACTDFSCIFNIITPTPTPSKIPIILLPGFMGSWNKNAILYNKDVSYNEWKLAPYVKEYDGIINTLINIGYQKDKDFYVFPYDWRKSVEQTVENLDLFINDIISKNSQSINKFNLVGHSLGGLVARIYTQKNKDKVNKILTVGSPHQGTVQVYKPLEGGEIDRENTFLWLAQKLILILNKSSIETNRETIRKKMPVIFDMFPTFDFLKNPNGEIIPISNLSIKNNLLNYYNQNFSQIFDIFVSIYGEKDKKTPAGFIVDFPNPIDKFLGNYEDGYPKNYYFDFGDYTILTKSANQDEDSQKLILDHGEIIYKKDGIKKILDVLGLNYDEDKIIEGKKTNIGRSLIFLIKSPAQIYVENNDHVYYENDGIIFIPDAETGNFRLKIQGKDLGKYQVVVGQISENNDIWEYINGEIIKTPPESQIDNYLINYFQDNAKPIFSEETKFSESVSENSATVLSNSNSNSQNLNNNLNPINNNKKNDSENLDKSKDNQKTNNLSNIRLSDINQSDSSKESYITPSPSIMPIFLSKREENNFYQNDKNLTENNQKVLGEKTKKETLEAFNNKKTLSRKIILFFILMPSVFLIFIFIKKKNIILYNFLNGFKNISSYINKK